MALTLLLLTFLAYLTGSFVLSQIPSVLGSPGQRVTISCTRSSGDISSYYVDWYQQRPASPPTNVIYKDNIRHSGVPSRFSGSIESSSNAAHLTISGEQPEDEADYYCQSYDSSYSPPVLQTHGELRPKLPRTLMSHQLSSVSPGNCEKECFAGETPLQENNLKSVLQTSHPSAHQVQETVEEVPMKLSTFINFPQKALMVRYEDNNSPNMDVLELKNLLLRFSLGAVTTVLGQ
ncbi:uncharacterized protein LOC101551093 [Sorex araneus]|uniref:uncharacterized protein LOC101551093 n=1 Tax=Sorex araneus TaxID=42254 RepID=UPI0024333D23|nr:uncharacterized protein LOC101551093 [Sorex araneus]